MTLGGVSFALDGVWRPGGLLAGCRSALCPAWPSVWQRAWRAAVPMVTGGGVAVSAENEKPCTGELEAGQGGTSRSCHARQLGVSLGPSGRAMHGS